VVAAVGGMDALVETGVLQNIGPETGCLWAVGHRGILAPGTPRTPDMTRT
jgi:hypothetical protein